jgi:CubicO group peptidase (beta-lactamase class C family)
MNAAINETMQKAIQSRIFPAADLLVAKSGDIIHHEYYGDARSGTTFDISSMTKAISTASLIMLLFSEGRLKLDQSVADWFEQANQEEHKKITIEMLLNHRSGLPRWRPLYRELPSSYVGTSEGKDFIINACLNEPLQGEPGSTTTYSDLGYILLGKIIEKASGSSLDELFAERIAKPLGLANTFFVRSGEKAIRTTSRRTDTSPDQHVPTPKKGPSNSDNNHKRRFAATEDCPWRGHVIHGEVHDQNAYAMGGVAGHAGLFSTAEDIHLFTKSFIASFKNEGFIEKNTVDRIFPIQSGLIAPPQPGAFVGGWDTPFEKNSAAGNYMSKHTIGHLGYTGCSIWIDQEKDFWVILLTNRIHPSTTNEKIKSFRPHIHDLIFKQLFNEVA